MGIFRPMNCRGYTGKVGQHRIPPHALLFLPLTLYAAEPGMVFIPGGQFHRGRTFEWADSTVKWYPAAHQDDLPVRLISVDPFYMDEAEVSNDRYAAFAKATR